MDGGALAVFLLQSAKVLRSTADELDACGLTTDAATLRRLSREHTRWLVCVIREYSLAAPPALVERVRHRGPR